MAWKNPKYKISEVSQTYNLKDLLGREPSDSEKKEFVDRAVQVIVERTQSGKDINGKKFTKYSKEYAKTKGVGRGDVDLTLTQDMLEAMRDKNIKKNLVKIQLGDSDVDTKKSFNHNVGDTLPKRTHFGLLEKEAEKIADQIKPRKTKTVGELLDEAGGLRGERV